MIEFPLGPAAQKALTLTFLLPCLLASCGGKKALDHVTGPTMGSTWSLQAEGANEEVRTLIQTHLDQREAVFSHWKADSALSRFNTSESMDWIPVPGELVEVVKLAHDIANQTDGVLDVTVGPLVDAWGFGPAGKRPAPPANLPLANVGWQHLAWRDAPPALKKDRADVRINVAAVTEGFVMDELVARLKQEGWKNFLLEIGGEVVASGLAPDGQPWRVGVQAPDGKKGESLESLALTDTCISTSGSYRHRYEKEGKSYSHLIDPRTGRPVEHQLVSVSVIHPRCGLADGYATALMILGPEVGRKTAQRLGLRVIWLEEP